MNSPFIDKSGIYAAEVQVAYRRAGIIGWLGAVGWLVFPFTLQNVLHPEDMVAWQRVFQGEGIPTSYTPQQLTAGLTEAAFILAVLILLQLVATVLFYRRVRLESGLNQKVAAPPLWPLAAIAAGIIGNAVWWIGLGYFDLAGCIVGLTPAALSVGCEMLCEKLGQDFVFGPNAGPSQFGVTQLFN